MKSPLVRRVGIALVLVGAGAAVVNFDALHWQLARRMDNPSLYAWHAGRACRHATEARQRHHDGVWARVLLGEDDRWLHEYLEHFSDGPHAEEARVRDDDRRWRIALENDYPEAYVASCPDGRHVEEAKAAALESAWRRAQTSATIQGYADYLSVEPERPHAAEARARIEELVWREVQATESSSVILDYLRTRPDGPLAAEARAKLDDVRYAESHRAVDEVAALLVYLRDEPEGRHVSEALARLERPLFERAREVLASPERAAWELTMAVEHPPGPMPDTAAGCLLAYLRSFPTGENAAEARALLESRLWSRATTYELPALYALYRDSCPDGPHIEAARIAAEGEDLAELVARGVVAVEALGASITNVGAQLTWVGPDTAPTPEDAAVCDGVTVKVPAGSYFDSGNSGVQNMLAYRTTRLRLHRGNPTTRPQLDVVCANKSLAIPTEQHGLTFAGPAPSAELVRVAQVIEESGAPYAVAQAAVWIVSDDANVAGLGSLVWQSYGVSRGSVIQPSDMGRALELCRQAGIDLGTRAIWQDRLALRAHVGPELYAAIGTPETLDEAARYGTVQELEAFLGAGAPGTEVVYEVLLRDDADLIRVVARASPDVTRLLHTAFRVQRTHHAALLVELGADPLAPDPETGETPIDLAAGAGDLEAVAFCVEHGADLEGKGRAHTPLWHAAAFGQVVAVRELLARGAPVDGGDETALMGGIHHPDVVRVLLEHGADPTRASAGAEGRTVLAYTLEQDFASDEVVRLLLEKGADPHLGSATRSPLQLAAEHGHLEAARLLLAAGAVAAQRPADTPTPLELARARLAELEADSFAMEWDLDEARALIDLLDD